MESKPATSNQQPATFLYRDRRAILAWLILCAALVALMVLVGGYTRLSGSGLSITEWKPIHGVVPPLDEAQWQEEFSAYQQSPQYQKVNQGMMLADFKTIFWPEFFHRLLGRAVGMVFFLPLLVFAARRSFSRRFGWQLAGIFALGGLQGLAGWLMVKSGLIDDPQVNFVRLAIHLSLAFLIYGLLVWKVIEVASGKWQVARKKEEIPPSYLLVTCHLPLATYSLWFTLLSLQIILGALLAGLHGGLVYNTWPDMNGQFAPPGLLADRIALVQFIHRNMAVLVAFGFIFWWYLQRAYVKNKQLGKVCAGITAILAAQFTLGVATLLHQVPLHLALAHQMTALLLFTVAVLLFYRLRNA